MEHQRNAAENPAAVAKVRKRRRPALSCVPCHRRKLKCNREFPICERCRKTGHAQDCIYRERAVQIPIAGGKPSSLVATMNSLPDTAIEEDGTAHSSVTETKTSLPTPEQSCHGKLREGDEAHVQEVVIFKGKDFLTKFYGYSYHRNLYQQVSLSHRA